MPDESQSEVVEYAVVDGKERRWRLGERQMWLVLCVRSCAGSADAPENRVLVASDLREGGCPFHHHRRRPNRVYH